MFGSHYVKISSIFFGLMAMAIAINVAKAAPATKKVALLTKVSQLTLSADSIKPVPMGKGSMLKGNVELHFGDKKTILADKVLVQYSGGKSSHVIGFIIYGKGSYYDNNKVKQFSNGVFNLDTQQLSAEQIG